MDKLKALFESISENAWGFGVLVLGVIVALVAHGTADKDLFGYAGGLSMTGAAIMHATKD